MKRNPVIGYVAFKSKMEIFCDGPSCIVAGSEKRMKTILKMRGLDSESHEIKKTRFEDILNGLMLGGEYGFDEESYSRFSPAGAEVGIPHVDFDFTPSEPGKIKFLNIKTEDGG